MTERQWWISQYQFGGSLRTVDADWRWAGVTGLVVSLAGHAFIVVVERSIQDQADADPARFMLGGGYSQAVRTLGTLQPLDEPLLAIAAICVLMIAGGFAMMRTIRSWS